MNSRTTKILRWIAWVWGGVVIGFLGFFVGAHLVEIIMEGNSNTIPPKEYVMFAFFPIGLLVGLIMAYKWEKIGAWLALISMVGLLVMRFDLIGDLYFSVAFTMPSILYLIAGYFGTEE